MPIVIVWSGQGKLVGEVDDIQSSTKNFNERKPIELKNARTLVEINQPVFDRPGGNLVGMNRAVNFMPMDAAAGPVTIEIIADMLSIPKGDHLDRVRELFKGAEDNEIQQRAMNSGLLLSSSVPVGRQ